MTMTLLIAALFASGAAFAVATITATLRAYWPAVVALLRAAEPGPQMQEILLTVTDLRVDQTGTVLRPDFSGRSRVPDRGLRAAA